MNDVQKRIAAKEIYNKYCVNCNRNKTKKCYVPTPNNDYARYKDKEFTLKETIDRRCSVYLKESE